MGAFKSCVECPFCKPFKPNNDMVNLRCEYNGKVTGLIEKRGLKVGQGDITPPEWCPYNKK